MLFDLPSDDTLYEALLRRDPRYDGRAYVGVSTTGVFCRLTCPARKPLRAHCSFYPDLGACLDAGFRPCKRCHPLAPAAAADPAIKDLMAALDADPGYRWGEADLVRRGYDPSTIRRSFKRHFGMTFLDMARQRRLAQGFTALETGKVIDAQLDAGFESPQAFRTAFARLLGAPPNSFPKGAMLRAAYINTPLGSMIAVTDKSALHLLEFADRKALPTELKRLRKMVKDDIGIGRFAIFAQLQTELGRYFSGESAVFNIPLVMHGSAFTRQVWQALRKIPAGDTRSYSALAREMGTPQSTRAVARANGVNQIALIIPCHRVIAADGQSTGYGGGLWRKQKLIELERHYAKRKTS
ncbi:trifunctional transcriptional activator/DNA repair protein Ada/methylated-DNA--[protein]-cysteine S-methyltransferase [Yoonia sp. SS1-5]|uniref:methylated-DNA--[protein]-cysteine S-methyltransferase n=1 Tax=Yoonia rhodophyticola TaxID=3137370 RepID=A0AAN0MBD7_9RHOB